MSENELAGEPKNVFVNSLIGYNNNLEIMLYINRVPTSYCIHALMSFISMLDRESQEKLKDITNELQNYYDNQKLVKSRIQL